MPRNGCGRAYAPLIRTGPYRWLKHPNYWIVVGEIALLPAAFGAYAVAAVFSILNAVLLLYRVRVEEGALTERRQTPSGTTDDS